MFGLSEITHKQLQKNIKKYSLLGIYETIFLRKKTNTNCLQSILIFIDYNRQELFKYNNNCCNHLL